MINNRINKKIDKKMLLAAWSCNNKFYHSYQAFHNPLREIFREVVNFDPQQEVYQYGKKIMNEKFIEVLKKEKPDYIMLFLVWHEFYPETLMKIKEILPNVKVVDWSGDDEIKFENYTIPYTKVIDYMFISQLQYSKDYQRFKIPIFDMLGCNINTFIPMNLPKKYDTCFIGSVKADRVELLRHLLENGIKFELYGGGWDKYPEFKEVYRGRISDKDMIKLINETRITLCFSKSDFNVRHVIERNMEVNACKCFGLTDYSEGYYSRFKEGSDIVTFKTKEELLEKVRYYLKHSKEREVIAKRAYKKVIKNFSFQKMMLNAFKLMELDKKKLHSKVPINKKVIYIGKDDFENINRLKKKISNFDYISFKNKDYEILSYRNEFQIYQMELFKKPISICNAYLSSKLVQDYAYLDLNYSYKYGDKYYFYKNLNISQFMVRKNYFLSNIDKFSSLYFGGKATFVNEDNTSFMSIPFLRTRLKNEIPLRSHEYILFLCLGSDLRMLNNQKRLFKDNYLYKLILYSTFMNHQVFKQLMLNMIKLSKKPYAVKISNFFDKIVFSEKKETELTDDEIYERGQHWYPSELY